MVQSLATRIRDTLRRHNCPGATVLCGVGGYGAHNVVHGAIPVDIPNRLPLVITFVDRTDRVAQVLPELGALINEGLITVMPVEVFKQSARAIGPFPAHLTVGDVMTRDVARVYPHTSAHEIVTLLIDRALRALPVVDDTARLVGRAAVLAALSHMDDVDKGG